MEWNNQVYYMIHWESNVEQYLYGSQITMHKNHKIYFNNHLMSTGSILSKWVSYTNYQKDRNSPALPNLINGKKYLLKNCYTNLSSGNLFLKVTFYDFFDQVVNSQLIKKSAGEISVPNSYKYYEIELMTAGCFEFEFYYLEICSSDMEEKNTELLFKGLITEYSQELIDEKDTLNIIFWEPKTHLCESEVKLIKAKLNNVIIIGQASDDYCLYTEQDNVETLQNFILKRMDMGLKINLWGSNRWSNVIATIYHLLIPGTNINIGPERIYLRDVNVLKTMLNQVNIDFKFIEQLVSTDESNGMVKDLLQYSNHSSQLFLERLKKL